MRNFVTVFFVMLLSFSAKLDAQLLHHYYYLEVVSNEGIPTIQNSSEQGMPPSFTFADANLTSLFQNAALVSFEKAFPTAKTALLQRTYQIECLDSLIADSLVMYYSNIYPIVEEIFEAKLLYTPNDYGFGGAGALQWALDLTNAKAAWDITHGDPNVIIGVTDTGFDLTHPELQNQIIQVDGTNIPHEHGTAVAGQIAGGTDNGVWLSAMGFNCKIHASTQMTTAEMLRLSQLGIKVLNASWYSSCSYNTFHAAVYEEIYQNGTVVCAGAGNGVSDNCGSATNYLYPASYPHVISVTGIGHTDNHEVTPYDPSWTHNHNDKVDLCAPGFEVNGITTMANGGYAGLWGTSHASPQVAGLVGLLFSINYCFSPDDIEYILKSTAAPIDQLPYNLPYQGLLGAGRIDAGAACQLAASMNNDVIINGNVVWNSEHFIGGDLIVEQGSRLTITNTKVRFAENSSLKVKQGAELIVDNAILSSQCTWHGIDVWGDATASQSGTFPNCPQGKIVLKNGAIIEHAQDAISTADYINSNSGGGIITAEDAIFRNNKRDIAFLQYLQPNISHFENCDFVVHNDYRFVTIKPRVTMWDVNKVVFTACDFDIQNPSFQFLSEGIFSIDAGYTVKAACSNIYTQNGCLPGAPSTFKHFANGIRATHASGSNTIIVDASQFEENVYGILSENMNDIQITRNVFEAGNANTANTWFNAGLVINTGTRYRVEENTFRGIGNTQTVGTFVYNTGTDNNEIYKNTYANLYVSNLSLGVNREIAPNAASAKGLQYVCNTQEDNVYDIAVGTGDGIRFFQGTPNAANPWTGLGLSHENTFSLNNTPEGNIYNHSNYPIIFIYDPNNTLTLAANSGITPGYVSQTIGNPNSCPNHILIDPNDELTSIEKAQLSNEFELHESDYITSLYLYNALIDGGNTQELQNNVNFQWSDDAWGLRDNLLAHSPNLSTEVLLEAANTGILPDAMLVEVLLANLRACQDREFLASLVNDIPNPLPQYMIDMLLNSTESTSLRKTLEMQIAAHSMEMSRVSTLIIHNILRDSLPNQDSLCYWYGRLNALFSDFSLAENELKAGNISASQTLMITLENQYHYAQRHEAEFEAYQDLFALKTQVIQDGRSWQQLNPTEIATLEVIASNTSADASVQAHNILRFATNHVYDIEPVFPEGTPQPRIAKNIVNASLSTLSVYPNPVKDFVTFDYVLVDEFHNVQIVITDALGRWIQTANLSAKQGQVIWDTRETAEGVYFYSLKKGSKTLKSGQVVVIK